MRLPALLVLAACTDPAVAMKLQLPANAAMYDTSCVGAVEVWVNGTNYPIDANDAHRGCIPITTHPATLSALADELRGKFDVAIPQDGLSGVEIYGYAGDCNPMTQAGSPVSPDLSFYAGTPYIGQDTLELALVPNVSCAQTPAKVHLVDMLLLGATKQCAQATVVGAGAGANLGTLSPQPFVDGLRFHGGFSGGSAVSGVVSIMGPMDVGPRSCLAAYAGDADHEALACVGIGHNVCAAAGELEVPVIDVAVANSSLELQKMQDFGAASFGAVWGTVGGIKQPLTGATITVADPARATVTYVDAPAGVETGTGQLTAHAGATTGASGMFVVYAKGLTTITITAAGKTKTVQVGATTDGPGTALVSMD